MAAHVLYQQDRIWMESIFTLAEGYGGGARRAQSLLCAWHNAEELGGFDFADLWSFDTEHFVAAMMVINLIGRLPQGTYPNDIEGFKDRMEAIARRRWKERQPPTTEDPDAPNEHT
jgi:hypothetical protein